MGLVCLLLLVGVCACRGKLPATTATAYPDAPASSTTPKAEQTSAAPASSTALPASPTPQGLPTTPAPAASPDPPPLPALISAGNAGALTPAAKQTFSPWDQVLALAWSPQGDALAASAGENLYLLSIPDLAERQRIALDVCAPALDFRPDGQLLASGDRNGRLRTWLAASGELQGEILAHQKPVSAVSYNPDGSILASAGYDAVARLWDSSSGAELSEMIGGTFAIPAIAFAPDGDSIAIVNGGVIRLRDTVSTRFVRTIAGETPFFTIAFSPDGRLLASGDVANTIQLWDLRAQTSPAIEIRQSLQTLTGHAGRIGRPEALVWQVAFSPDGSLLASAGGDETVRVWEVASGRLLATLTGHTQAVTSVAFSPDGRWLASGGLDGAIILWNAAAPMP
jgi:WD40 repeat protein